MRLIDDSPVLAQLIHDDVHIMVWKAAIDAPTLERTRTAGLDLSRANPQGFWALNVIGHGISIPSFALQRKAAEIEKQLDTALRGAAVVLPGEGFWVSAARSFLAGISMLTPSRSKREIVADVASATKWLATRSGRSEAWAETLARELERSGVLETK